MHNIILCTKNVFRDGTLTVTGEDSDSPKERLVDGDRNDLWTYTSTTSSSFTVTLSNTESVDFLAISGHNFSGETMSWEYYDGSWHDVIADWIQGNNNNIYKTVSSPVSGTRFRVTVTSMTNPECAEIFCSLKSLDKHPFQPWPEPGSEDNKTVGYTRSGHRWAILHGDTKWSCKYFFKLSGDEIDDWEQCMIDCVDGFYPFYMYDHDNVLRYVELTAPPKKPYIIPGTASINSYQSVEFTVREVF